VGNSNIMSNAAKNFDILTTSLSVLHNYFDSLTKLFLDLYLAKFSDTSAKSFFPYIYIYIYIYI